MIRLYRDSLQNKGNTSPDRRRSPCISAFPMVRCLVNTSPYTSPHPPPVRHHQPPMCCCDAGKRRLLQITYHLVTIITQHPTPITQHPTPKLVRCLVRSLVRCSVNTPPSETPVHKGFPRVLVRCCKQLISQPPYALCRQPGGRCLILCQRLVHSAF